MKLEPKQKRSVLTRKKIMDTAKELFTERGYYRVTSNQIAKEAKVPIGSFYAYFANKKELMLALITSANDAFYQDAIQGNLAAAVPLQSREDASQIIFDSVLNTLLATYLSDPFYKIIHSLQFTEPDVLALSEQIRKKEIGAIELALQRIHEIYPLEKIPVKAKLIHSTVENVGLYIHLLGAETNKEELMAETAEMVIKYLFTD